MKSVLVIAQAGSNVLTGDQAQLQRVTDARVYGCFFEELSIELSPHVFTIADHRNNRGLETYDLVLFRGSFTKMYLANVICQFLAMHNIEVKNDYRSYKSANKLLQLVEFYAQGLPFPRTFYSADRDLLLERAVGEIGYPFIVKAVSSSRGNNNFLVRDKRSLKRVRKQPPTTFFVAQTYIPNDHDYRILCIGKESIVVERTAKSDSHLNNWSQGATIQHVGDDVLPPALITRTKTMVRQQGLSIAGVDIVVDKTTGEYYFLEINLQPGWGTLEMEVAPLLRDMFRRKA